MTTMEQDRMLSATEILQKRIAAIKASRNHTAPSLFDIEQTNIYRPLYSFPDHPPCIPSVSIPFGIRYLSVDVNTMECTECNEFDELDECGAKRKALDNSPFDLNDVTVKKHKGCEVEGQAETTEPSEAKATEAKR